MDDSPEIQSFLKQLHQKCNCYINWNRDPRDWIYWLIECINRPINDELVPMLQEDFNHENDY